MAKKVNNEAKEYVEKKIKRKKHWRTKQRTKRAKEDIIYNYQHKYLACIDPHTYKLVRIFDSILEMEYDTNTRNLQPILHRYFNNPSKNGKHTICNWIVVQFKKDEIEDTTLEEFQDNIRKKALDKIISIQMSRIKDNIEALTNQEKERLFQLLAVVESPNSTAEDYKIEF